MSPDFRNTGLSPIDSVYLLDVSCKLSALEWIPIVQQQCHLHPNVHQPALPTLLNCRELRTPLYVEIALHWLRSTHSLLMQLLTLFRTASGLEMPSNLLLRCNISQPGSTTLMASGKTRFR
jgi:hypothetical protein